MSAVVDKIITIFKAMSADEKIDLVHQMAQDPDIKKEVEQRTPAVAKTKSGKKKGAWSGGKSAWWIKTFDGVDNGTDSKGKKLRGTFRVKGKFIKDFATHMSKGDYCVVHSRSNSEYHVAQYTGGTSDKVDVPESTGVTTSLVGMKICDTFDNANALCDAWESRL